MNSPLPSKTYSPRDCFLIASENVDAARNALDGVYFLHNAANSLHQIRPDALEKCGVLLGKLDSIYKELSELIGKPIGSVK